MKVCPNCGDPVLGMRQFWCSDTCGQAGRRRRHYQDNPEYYKNKRIRENSDVPRRILARVKSRARKCCIPFDLDLSDINVPDTCPVLGIKIQVIPGCGRNPRHSPSLDRIDPTKGYTKGNVRVISNRANLLKSNATIEELELILKDLREIDLADNPRH